MRHKISVSIRALLAKALARKVFQNRLSYIRRNRRTSRAGFHLVQSSSRLARIQTALARLEQTADKSRALLAARTLKSRLP